MSPWLQHGANPSQLLTQTPPSTRFEWEGRSGERPLEHPVWDLNPQITQLERLVTLPIRLTGLGTGGRTRTLNNGFGDRCVTITPHPYGVATGIRTRTSTLARLSAGHYHYDDLDTDSGYQRRLINLHSVDTWRAFVRRGGFEPPMPNPESGVLPVTPPAKESCYSVVKMPLLTFS